jgi:hypothetical protein
VPDDNQSRCAPTQHAPAPEIEGRPPTSPSPPVLTAGHRHQEGERKRPSSENATDRQYDQGVSNPIEQQGGPFGVGPRRRTRFAIPDSPVVAVVTAVLTLALAVVLFLAAMPGEERVLYFEGEQVGPSEICETTGADGEPVLTACAEVGEFETRPTGWSVVPAVIAGVLAAAAVVVLAGVPKQLRERRAEEIARMERLTDEDFKG